MSDVSRSEQDFLDLCRELMPTILQATKDQQAVNDLVECAQSTAHATKKEDSTAFFTALLGYTDVPDDLVSSFILAVIHVVSGEHDLAVYDYISMGRIYFNLRLYDDSVACFHIAFAIPHVDHINILEQTDSNILDVLSKLSPAIKDLADKKERVRKIFREHLQALSSIKSPVCFISFMSDTKVTPWINNVLSQDLADAKLTFVLGGDNCGHNTERVAFQATYINSEKIIVICTPSANSKCIAKQHCPTGYVAEVRMARMHPDKVFPVYFEGNRENACPFPVFAKDYSVSPCYYNFCFSLVGDMKSVDPNIIAKLQADFWKQVSLL
jgi:hypothetical protein